MKSQLIQIRIKSFFYSVVSYLGIGILTFLLSPETISNVLALASEHFGSSSIISLLVLVVPEVAKHFRNTYELGKLRGEDVEEVILI